MKLFNGSSIFNVSEADIIKLLSNSEHIEEKIIELKRKLLKAYNFSVLNLPDDFKETSYIIAANHLTDSDAPLIMSYYYELMNGISDGYPQLFVFAKENCFNGVSIPQELLPLLEHEKVVAVDRNKATGSLAAIKEASRWVKAAEGKARHFLIFSQGTIYDINKDKPEDIERGAFWLASVLGIPVLPAFIEMAVEGELNRLVFGKPIAIPKNCREYDDYKKQWMDEVIAAQDSLGELTGVPAREAVLDEEHKIRKRFKPE